jgi:tRNA threonylcarbamoyladenosine biosynthesis protein TsaB
LDSIGADFQDINLIAIDNGPGNLAAVRAAVSYANGLAFSLGCNIYCADSLSLMSLEASESFSEAVLCVQNAGGGNIYAGMFPAGRRRIMRHGPFAKVISAMTRDLTAVALAGKFRCEIADALPSNIEVSDSKIEFPDIKFLHRALISTVTRAPNIAPFARPITEESDIFIKTL